MPEETAQPAPKVERITQEQATALVGRHALAALEDVITSHRAILEDPKVDEERKANARLIVAAAEGLGRPLFRVVKVAERPRILRPDRAIRIVR